MGEGAELETEEKDYDFTGSNYATIIHPSEPFNIGQFCCVGFSPPRLSVLSPLKESPRLPMASVLSTEPCDTFPQAKIRGNVGDGDW